MVMTIDSIAPSSDRMGVAFINVVMLLPSGTHMVISSARTVSPMLRSSAIENSCKDSSRPSARLKLKASSSCSTVWSGPRRWSAIL